MRDPVPCPACGAPLCEEDFGSARVRVCGSGACRGILLAGDALDRLDTEGRGLGPALARALGAPRTADLGRGPLACPDCGAAMEVMPHPDVADVRMDVCPGCWAVFLDGGELAAIRRSPGRLEARAHLRRSLRLRRRRRAREADRRRAAAAAVTRLMLG